MEVTDLLLSLASQALMRFRQVRPSADHVLPDFLARRRTSLLVMLQTERLLINQVVKKLVNLALKDLSAPTCQLLHPVLHSSTPQRAMPIAFLVMKDKNVYGRKRSAFTELLRMIAVLLKAL